MSPAQTTCAIAAILISFRPTSHAEPCIANGPITNGVCYIMDKCLCSNHENSRLRVQQMRHVMYCNGRAAVKDFRKPVQFSYHKSKNDKQYLAIFTQYKTDGSLYIHWFEGDIPGKLLRRGSNIRGVRTMPYMPIIKSASDSGLRTYQLLLFEQPTMTMMGRLRRNEGHDLYAQDATKRHWTNLRVTMQKYRMCGSLVASYQFQVANKQADERLLPNMCEPIAFMEPMVTAGFNTAVDQYTNACRCVVEADQTIRLRFAMPELSCGMSSERCPWRVIVRSQDYESGCFNMTRTRMWCCDELPAITVFPKAVRTTFFIEKETTSALQGYISLYAAHANTDVTMLLVIRCGRADYKINDECVPTTPRSKFFNPTDVDEASDGGYIHPTVVLGDKHSDEPEKQGTTPTRLSKYDFMDYIDNTAVFASGAFLLFSIAVFVGCALNDYSRR